MRVQIHTLEDGKDTVAGTLTSEGGPILCEPDSPMLREILETPIREHQTGEEITSDTPEVFLRNLKYAYRSAYLRAGEADILPNSKGE